MARIETLSEGISLYPGDCLDVLAALEANSIDSCVTDPPYHLTSMVQRLSRTNGADVEKNFTKTIEGQAANPFASAARGFMGKSWDGGDIAFRPEIWAQVLRVLKPGGHLLSFGGTRTYHRMACAIEDAGFEIRDSIQWLYGSGFPKSHDVSKGIDKAAGAEREVTRAGTVKRDGYGDDWDTGPSTDRPRYDLPITVAARAWDGWGTALKPACEPIVLARKPLSESTVAANVLKWGTGALNIDGTRIATSDTYSYDRKGGSPIHGGGENVDIAAASNPMGRWPANVIHDGSDEVVGAFPAEAGGGFGKRGGQRESEYGFGGTMQQVGFGDSGSAARFFYTAKADQDDRLGSKHPTVKPVDLIQYLVRLVTPPRGLVLDCFAGTGTTGEACIREKLRCILIEREAEYCDDIRRRMKLAMAGPDERVRESAKVRNPNPDLGPLFQDYDPQKDLAGSIADGFAAIRERKAAGGQGWGE